MVSDISSNGENGHDARSVQSNFKRQMDWLIHKRE